MCYQRCLLLHLHQATPHTLSWRMVHFTSLLISHSMQLRYLVRRLHVVVIGFVKYPAVPRLFLHLPPPRQKCAKNKMSCPLRGVDFFSEKTRLRPAYSLGKKVWLLPYVVTKSRHRKFLVGLGKFQLSCRSNLSCRMLSLRPGLYQVNAEVSPLFVNGFTR